MEVVRCPAPGKVLRWDRALPPMSKPKVVPPVLRSALRLDCRGNLGMERCKLGGAAVLARPRMQHERDLSERPCDRPPKHQGVLRTPARHFGWRAGSAATNRPHLQFGRVDWTGKGQTMRCQMAPRARLVLSRGGGRPWAACCWAGKAGCCNRHTPLSGRERAGKPRPLRGG